MKINGYKLAKTLSIRGITNEPEHSEDPLMILLSGFPELKRSFFSGESIIIKASAEHLGFLENEISVRLKKLNTGWKDRFDDKKKEVLKKQQRIVHVSFLNDEYEINTFGDPENDVTLDLIRFYNLLKDSSEIFGLSVIPEIRL